MSTVEAHGPARLGKDFGKPIEVQKIDFAGALKGAAAGVHKEKVREEKDRPRREKERQDAIDEGSLDTRLKRQRAQRKLFAAAGLDSPHRIQGIPYENRQRRPPESESPPYARGPAPARAGLPPGSPNLVHVQHPMSGPQWGHIERLDRPDPNARPMPVPRTPLSSIRANISVMPDIQDRAVNREPGQMTLFPDLPHSQPQSTPDLGMHGPQNKPYTGGFVAQPGGVGQDQPEGTQGYLFRDKTDKEQARSAVTKSRQKSQRAWEDS